MISLHRPLPRPVIAVGGDVKCVPAVGRGDRVDFLDDVGDLAAPESQDHLRRLLQQAIAEAGRDAVIVCDRHPGYFSARIARETAAAHLLPLVAVQHHRAHVAAVAAEYGIEETVVGLAFDGTGYGDDGTIWGGEIFTGSLDGGYARRACFTPLRLLGGDRAVREPWRVALAALLDRDWSEDDVRAWLHRVGVPDDGLALFRAALERGLGVAVTTALGRWFDCAAALLGVCTDAPREAQAAIALEQAAAGAEAADPAPGYWSLDRKVDPIRIVLPGLFAAAREENVDLAVAAAMFHHAVAAATAAVAAELAAETGATKVLAGGGCFFNRILSADLARLLPAAGLEWLPPRALLPGDQALALGQIVLAARNERGF